MLYFAYGSNMDAARLRTRVPSAAVLGIAYLDDYRLAFTRRSILGSTGGVADIVAATSFTVVGVAFEIDDADLPALDRAEGLDLTPAAYHRRSVDIRLAGKAAYRQAETFQVVAPSDHEVVPDPNYLGRMQNALEQFKPAEVARSGPDGEHVTRLNQYLKFLAWLRSVAGSDDVSRVGSDFTRPGLLLTKTNTGRGGSGAPVIQYRHSAGTPAGRYAVVTVNGVDAIGRAVRDNSHPAGSVAVDQRLRHALGLPGQLAFGYTANLEGLAGSPRRTFDTRTVTLRLSQARISDAERQLVVLHPRNLQLLGVSDGDFVDVIRPIRAPGATTATFRRRTFRCMSAGTGPDFPLLDRVYLDEQCRRQLGIEPGEKYLVAPLLIRPNVARAAAARSVAYGLTVLFGVSTFTDLIDRFTSFGPAVVGVIALAVGVAVTAGVAYVDLRAKLRP